MLRLFAENDRLKIRELEDRKRMQHLLTLTQPVNGETTYFLTEPPAKVELFLLPVIMMYIVAIANSTWPRFQAA